MLNSCINATRTQDCIIIGGQQFRVEPAILANFTKLDLLFSPDFVFKNDFSTQNNHFMSYEVAQDLMAILSSNQASLAGYSASELVSVSKLANYLGLSDKSVLEKNNF